MNDKWEDIREEKQKKLFTESEVVLNNHNTLIKSFAKMYISETEKLLKILEIDMPNGRDVFRLLNVYNDAKDSLEKEMAVVDDLNAIRYQLSNRQLTENEFYNISHKIEDYKLFKR